MKSKVWVNDLKFWIYQAIFLTKIIVNFLKLILKKYQLNIYTNAYVYVDRNVKKLFKCFPEQKEQHEDIPMHNISGSMVCTGNQEF